MERHGTLGSIANQNLLYSARPLDVRQLGRGPGVHPEGGRDLPSRPKIASCLGAQPLGRPGAASLFTARVLRTDRTRPSVRQPPKVTEVHPEPVEVGNRLSRLSYFGPFFALML